MPAEVQALADGARLALALMYKVIFKVLAEFQVQLVGFREFLFTNDG